MIIYAADDPLVLNGTYDQEGYKPGERARLAKHKARLAAQTKGVALDMAKPKGTHRTVRAGSRAAKQADRASRRAQRRPRPRQQDLPGTEDRAIKPLEDVAASYAEVRDERIELNQREADLKALAVKLMHKFDKTIYRHDGIEIRLVPGEEDVKVRIKKAGEDAPSDGEGDEPSDGE